MWGTSRQRDKKAGCFQQGALFIGRIIGLDRRKAGLKLLWKEGTLSGIASGTGQSLPAAVAVFNKTHAQEADWEESELRDTGKEKYVITKTR